MYNPTKAPSQLTSGIPSRPTRGHGWTQDSWRYCEDAQKSLSEAYMFLLKKDYHNNIDTDLDFWGKSIKEMFYCMI